MARSPLRAGVGHADSTCRLESCFRAIDARNTLLIPDTARSGLPAMHFLTVFKPGTCLCIARAQTG